MPLPIDLTRSPVPAVAQALAEAAEGPITAMNPASVLQLHPDARVCLDEAAATQLKRAEYYRWVFANKPQWQRV